MNKKEKQLKNPENIDVVSEGKCEWAYTDIVKNHFFNPRNFVKGDYRGKYSGLGLVGSPACGDMMKVWISVSIPKPTKRKPKPLPSEEIIKKCQWQTFGCASAIASTSIMSEMAKGLSIEQALKITPMDIVNNLGGLPTRKIHCSVLGDKALRSAINDYFRRTGQPERIVHEGGKIIDKVLSITNKDIEDAVLHGANNFSDVQKQTKVGIGDPTCVEEAKQLTQFYMEKYFGDMEK